MNNLLTSATLAMLATSSVAFAEDVQITSIQRVVKAWVQDDQGGFDSDFDDDWNFSIGDWDADAHAWLGSDNNLNANQDSETAPNADNGAYMSKAIADGSLSIEAVSSDSPQHITNGTSGIDVTLNAVHPTYMQISTVINGDSDHSSSMRYEVSIRNLDTNIFVLDETVYFSNPETLHKNFFVPAGEYQVMVYLQYDHVWEYEESTYADMYFYIGASYWHDEPEYPQEMDPEAQSDPGDDSMTVAVSTEDATTDTEMEFGCAGVIGHDLWYTFSPSRAGLSTLSTCNAADFDTQIAVYEGLDLPLTPERLVACNDDSDGCEGYTSSLTFAHECGKKYLVQIGGYGDARGSGYLTLTRDLSQPPCEATSPADITGDGRVNGADMGRLLAFWGQPGIGDLNGDGVTNGADLGLLFADWTG